MQSGESIFEKLQKCIVGPNPTLSAMNEYKISYENAKKMTISEVIAKAFKMSKSQAKRVINQGGAKIFITL